MILKGERYINPLTYREIKNGVDSAGWKGMEKGVQQVAHRMKAMGLPVETIATGLSPADVEALS